MKYARIARAHGPEGATQKAGNNIRNDLQSGNKYPASSPESALAMLPAHLSILLFTGSTCARGGRSKCSAPANKLKINFIDSKITVFLYTVPRLLYRPGLSSEVSEDLFKIHGEPAL